MKIVVQFTIPAVMARNGHRQRITIFNVISWVMGGLSCLNLIRDLTPIEIFGLLKEWMDAYSLLIRRIGSFLFGWIDWRWMRISESEHHLLVIALLLALAYARASAPLGKSNETALHRRVAAMSASLWFFFVPPLLAAVLMPPVFAVLLGLLYLAFWTWTFALAGDRHRGGPTVPTNKAVRTEVYGVVTVFLLLVIVNYVVFKP